MPLVVVIPIKSFRMGKQRLSASLDDDRRARLGTSLAGHVAGTVASADLLPLIVTADPEVAAWATVSGFPSLPDADEGLDAAAATGVMWARDSASRWIVLHGDLPLLTEADVLRLGSISASGRPLIAPSADGGTSAIGAPADFAFSFGAASFHRHLRALDSPEIVIRTGLALDVDSPDDLTAAGRTARGAWLREILR